MTSRREFLFSGAWLALNLPMLEQLGREARQSFELGLPFETLTAAEARTMEAFAAQIIPTTDTPGAREAGAVHFIDKALGLWMKDALEPVRAGIKDLDARAVKKSATTFADLPSEDQIAVIKDIERTPFFNLGRDLTVFGTFCDPKHGGNKNHVAHQILNMEHQTAYQPPFGYYDAQVSK